MALSPGRTPAARPPRDPGLQAERTALAWNRTGLTLLVNAVLALRLGLAAGQSLMLALGGTLLCGAGAVMWIGRQRRRSLLGDTRIGGPPLWMVRFTLLAAVAAAFAGVAGVLVSMPR